MDDKKRERRIKKLEREIELAPEGDILCWKRNGKNYWYHLIHSKRYYINKKERNMAEKLAYKKYRKRELAELKYLGHIEKRSIPRRPKSSLALLFDPAYRELIIPLLDEDERSAAEWITEDYTKNPFHREELSIKTPTGEKVRSKSEYIIYKALLDAGVPFRYESAFTLQGKTIFPDFIIMHPKTGRIYIWEHFGLMDNSGYAARAFAKMAAYNVDGWQLMDNLIVTTESSNHPLDTEWVKKVIEFYFLN